MVTVSTASAVVVQAFLTAINIVQKAAAPNTAGHHHHTLPDIQSTRIFGSTRLETHLIIQHDKAYTMLIERPNIPHLKACTLCNFRQFTLYVPRCLSVSVP